MYGKRSELIADFLKILARTQFLTLYEGWRWGEEGLGMRCVIFVGCVL